MKTNVMKQCGQKQNSQCSKCFILFIFLTIYIFDKITRAVQKTMCSTIPAIVSTAIIVNRVQPLV